MCSTCRELTVPYDEAVSISLSYATCTHRADPNYFTHWYLNVLSTIKENNSDSFPIFLSSQLLISETTCVSK